MWEHIVKGALNVKWIMDTLAHSTFLGMTDGSYDREHAHKVSGSGRIIVCTVCHQTLRGSLIKISPSAGSYRVKLLGLVAIHTFAIALGQYFLLKKVAGEISCDNMAALKPSQQDQEAGRGQG